MFFAVEALLSSVQGISKLLGGVTCVVVVTVSRLIQFGLQGGDLEPVRKLLLLQCLFILMKMNAYEKMSTWVHVYIFQLYVQDGG